MRKKSIPPEQPFGSLRYNAIGPFLKNEFGCRVVKLSLDGGFTCPNRDGRCGTGGCLFCAEDGSGRFASDIPGEIALTSQKWPDAKYIAYFQNFTNTYAPVERLRALWDEALGYREENGPLRARSRYLGPLPAVLSSDFASGSSIAKNRVPRIPVRGPFSSLFQEPKPEFSEDITSLRARSRYLESLQARSAKSFPDMVGLAVATRPDCLPEDVLDLLSEYNEKTFLWVELGLQTSKQKTADYINRCYDNSVYEKAVSELKARGIRYVTHLILGLPGESEKDMLDSAAYVNAFSPFGLKLHMLHVMEGTRLGEIYKEQPFELLSKQDYVNTVCDILERTPQSVTIHRLTGDAPGDMLLAPEWTRDKHAVLNSIQQELKRRGSFQGSLL